jgi:hypothetical protein
VTADIIAFEKARSGAVVPAEPGLALTMPECGDDFLFACARDIYFEAKEIEQQLDGLRSRIRTVKSAALELAEARKQTEGVKP